MITIVVAVLAILWFLGYVQIPYIPLTDINLFNLFGRQITLHNVLVFLLVIWLIDLLPDPFRTIASVVLIIWLLSLFGIIAIAGFSNIVILALIIGIGIYLVTRGR